MDKNSVMNETLATLLSRRSVKKYKSTPVEECYLDAILAAGMNAPTGKNRQSPIMVVLTKKEDIDAVERLNAEALGARDSHPFYGAPVVVVVLADKSWFTYKEDGSLVIGNMLNAAHSLGIGACWIHRAREVFDSEEGKALLRKWGIPDGYEGIGNCVIGYADGELPPEKPKKKDYIYRV